MLEDLSSEETTLLAAYPTRHDAEVAKSFLEEHEIEAFIAADDTHVPLQMTEGARLHVLTADAYEAGEMLGAPPAAGRAQVSIDEYRYVFERTDAYNTARLSGAEPL